MGNIKTAAKVVQLEIIWSSPRVPVWAQLTLDVRKETTRLLAEMLIEAEKTGRENAGSEDEETNE
jgi:hypothetical protein